MDNKKDSKNKTKKLNKEELGAWTKEMCKPENIIGPFNSTEELMKSLWDEDNNNETL